jgi:hypothetical protein
MDNFDGGNFKQLSKIQFTGFLLIDAPTAGGGDCGWAGAQYEVDVIRRSNCGLIPGFSAARSGASGAYWGRLRSWGARTHGGHLAVQHGQLAARRTAAAIVGPRQWTGLQLCFFVVAPQADQAAQHNNWRECLTRLKRAICGMKKSINRKWTIMLQPFNKYVRGYRQPRYQIALTTLWQICYRGPKSIGNFLRNSSERISHFCKYPISTFLQYLWRT